MRLVFAEWKYPRVKIEVVSELGPVAQVKKIRWNPLQCSAVLLGRDRLPFWCLRCLGAPYRAFPMVHAYIERCTAQPAGLLADARALCVSTTSHDVCSVLNSRRSGFTFLFNTSSAR